MGARLIGSPLTSAFRHRRAGLKDVGVSVAVLIGAQRGAMATSEEVRSRTVVFIQRLEERLPLRTVFQSGGVLNRSDRFGAQRQQFCTTSLADELACVVTVGEPRFLLPAAETRRTLADFGDLRVA